MFQTLARVNAALATVQGTLPPTAKLRADRLTFAAFPIMGYSLTSDTVPQTKLWEIATYELKRSDGASVQIKAGYAYPLAFVPIPILGCLPRDWAGGARNTFKVANGWICAAYFARDFVTLLGAARDGKRRGATDAVAGALKLPASSVTARFPERSS